MRVELLLTAVDHLLFKTHFSYVIIENKAVSKVIFFPK